MVIYLFLIWGVYRNLLFSTRDSFKSDLPREKEGIATPTYYQPSA